MDLSFYKLRICESDVILIDDLEGKYGSGDFGAAAAAILDRRRGAGADRLALIQSSGETVWLRVYGPDGARSLCLFDAALAAARYLLDSGHGSSEGIKLKTPSGWLAADLLDGSSLGISLGAPYGLAGQLSGDAGANAAAPAARALGTENAGGFRTLIETEGARYEALPLGIRPASESGPILKRSTHTADHTIEKRKAADRAEVTSARETEKGSSPEAGQEHDQSLVSAVAFICDGGATAARASIKASTRGAAVPPPLPLRIISRSELWVQAQHSAELDAAASAGLALGAAASLGYAERGAAVRIRGGALYVEWTEHSGLYVAASPEYVYHGDFHLDEPRGQK